MATAGHAVRINHSGGSPGADAAWRDIGAEFGVETRSYRPFDDPQPDDPTSVVLSREQLREADPHILAADEELGAGFNALPERQQNYARRNWFQVRQAQAAYAVGRILWRERSGMGMDCVAGGTQWAFAMAARRRQPIFVFDDEEGCLECTRRWHRFDQVTGRLVPLPQGACGGSAQHDARVAAKRGESGQLAPPLPAEFAGVGTRSLGAAGRHAIRQLYEATYRCDERCAGTGK